MISAVELTPVKSAGSVETVCSQVNVPRAETIMEDGHDVPASMGTATAINFQPTGGGKAAITLGQAEGLNGHARSVALRTDPRAT